MVRGVNVIRGSKPPIEASSTPQNVTDTTFDTKILKHVFKNIQLLLYSIVSIDQIKRLHRMVDC